MVETALILPILLFMIMGIIDFGRVLFTYGQASSQLREALRMAAAIGVPTDVGSTPPYRDCPAMTSLAQKVYFATPSNITIGYARVFSGTPTAFSGGDFTGALDTCSYNLAGTGSGNLGPSDLANGDILRISEDVSVSMITPILPWRTLTVKLQGQRTIITGITLATDYCGDLVCGSGESNPSDPQCTPSSVGACFCMADCAQPDLRLSINGPGTIQTGFPINYTFTITNTQPIPHNTPAPGVTVTYVIPANVQYAGCSPVPCGPTSAISPPPVGTTVVWTLGDLPYPATRQVTLQIIPLVPMTPMQVQASVATSGTDPGDYNNCVTHPGDNLACFNTVVYTVGGDMGIGVIANASTGGLPFGDQIIYTMTVYEGGGATTPTGVHAILDGIPLGFTLADSGGCSISTGATAQKADCNLGTPSVSAYPVTEHVTFNAMQAGTFTATATLTVASGWTFPDTVPGNETSTWNYTVNPPQAGLSITKTTSTPRVSVGAPVTYTLKIQNIQGNTAQTPTVVDTLPDDSANSQAAIAYNSYTNPGGNVTGFTQSGPDGTVLTFSLGNIGLNATTTIVINATAQSVGNWQNSAAVSSPTFDPDTSDNLSIVPVAVDVLGQVTGLNLWRPRCGGRMNRRYVGLSWNRVYAADSYYIYANGVLVGQTTDQTSRTPGKITQCGNSVSRTRTNRVSGCYNLSPSSWVPGATVTYTVAAFIVNPSLQIGPQSAALDVTC